MTHYPGHSVDDLIFRVPLRGDFEVSWKLRLGGYREPRVGYGGVRLDLRHDRKAFTLVGTGRTGGREVTITPPLAGEGDTYAFKLAVRGGVMKMFVDGRELASERIGPTPEPWLTITGDYQNTGDLRELAVAGTPTVPASIDLLADDDLSQWQTFAGEAWQKRGEELFHDGRQPEPPDDGKPVQPRRPSEAAVFHPRPMTEDGAVEYEFFYGPDSTAVHPALDRLVFLLEPGGVKLHWLSDGPGGALPFDNESEEPDRRRGPTVLPLKSKAWNRERLAVTGDTVTVALNGTGVYERPIEPTNQRRFGLFHYTDRSAARARSMTDSGDWPRQLPPNDKLFETRR